MNSKHRLTDENGDVRELTKADLANARPLREAKPDLWEKLQKVRGPQRSPTKEKVSVRLDRDIIAHFKAEGRGWQTRMNDYLRKSLGL